MMNKTTAKTVPALITHPVYTPTGEQTFVEWPTRRIDELAWELIESQARWTPISQRTINSRSRVIREHIVPAFGHLSVREVDARMVFDWHLSLKETHPRAASGSLRFLEQVFCGASSEGLIWRNPAGAARRAAKGEPDALSSTLRDDEELYRLVFDYTYRGTRPAPGRSGHLLDFLELVLETGLELDELATLRWNNLNWVSGRFVYRGMTFSAMVSNLFRERRDEYPLTEYLFEGENGEPFGVNFMKLHLLVAEEWGGVTREPQPTISDADAAGGRTDTVTD